MLMFEIVMLAFVLSSVFTSVFVSFWPNDTMPKCIIFPYKVFVILQLLNQQTVQIVIVFLYSLFCLGFYI